MPCLRAVAIVTLLLGTLRIVQADDDWVQPLVKRVQDSVVLITVEGRDGGQAGLGTGFVVASDGLIATNLHVVGEARPVHVQFRDGREFRVSEIYASDRALDLAVIRIPAEGLDALELSDSLAPSAADQALEQGTPVVALGNPMGFRHSVVQGVVSGTREIGERSMIQIAMPVERGNSGGPLVNRQGKVLGIITLKSAVTANLGFAVPSSDLRSLLEKPNPIAMDRWQTIGSLDPHQWETLFGSNWKQRSGRIFVSESGEGFGGRTLCLSRAEVPAGRYEVGVFVKLSQESGAAGLVFDADGHDRHYGFYPSGGRLRLTHFLGPNVNSWQILEEIRSPHYRLGEWNHLKIRVSDNQLTCFVNDQPIATRVLAAATPGRVGLAKFRDTEAVFKQFRVADEIALTQLPESVMAPFVESINQLSLSDWSDPAQLDPFLADPVVGGYALRQQAARLEDDARRLHQIASDVHVAAVCRQLIDVLETQANKSSASQPHLAHAALLVASLDNPELEINSYLEQLDRMTLELEAAVPDGATPADRLSTLNDYLFSQNGFHGSRTNYYHAANSYFDRVLDDREGIPLTLSILYIELGTRIGLTLEGVGLPGHFVVRHVIDNDPQRFVDVFDRGRLMSRDDAETLVIQLSGQPLTDAMLAASTPPMIVRMLRNLRSIAERDRESEALLRYLEAMVCLQPDDPALRVLRAVVRHETGRKQAALNDLDQLLSEAPAGLILEAVRQMREAFQP